MSEKHYSFFENVNKTFDKAAAFTKWDPGVLEQIKECNAVYQMKFPVKMDDGRIEVIEAYQCSAFPTQNTLQRWDTICC